MVPCNVSPHKHSKELLLLFLPSHDSLIYFYVSCDRYTFSSIESQIRVLGDYAFMLRDYELALSNYRLLSTDYKLDKAWKRYAGVQVIYYFSTDGLH